MGLSFLYHHYEDIQGDGVMHGVNWMSVGKMEWLRWFPYTLYYILMFCLVSFDDEERERSS